MYGQVGIYAHASMYIHACMCVYAQVDMCLFVCVYVGPMLCVGVTRDDWLCLHLPSPPGIPCCEMDMQVRRKRLVPVSCNLWPHVVLPHVDSPHLIILMLLMLLLHAFSTDEFTGLDINQNYNALPNYLTLPKCRLLCEVDCETMPYLSFFSCSLQLVIPHAGYLASVLFVRPSQGLYPGSSSLATGSSAFYLSFYQLQLC